MNHFAARLFSESWFSERMHGKVMRSGERYGSDAMKKAMTLVVAACLATCAGAETFISSAFRLDLRMENGIRSAEPEEIVQTSAAWREGLEAGSGVAVTTHRAPGAEGTEEMHRTTSAGTESFVWDALHAVPGEHVFTHTIWDAGKAVDTMSVSFAVPEPRLEAVRVFGPTNFASGSGAKYVCMGYFSDGSGREVEAEWSLAGGASGVTVGADGTVTAGQATVAQSVGVRAAAEVDGASAADELTVTVSAAWLRLAQTRMSVEKGASEGTVTVKCSGEWKAESSAEWLELTEVSGTGDGVLAFTVGRNTNTSSRTATVTVRCEPLLSTKLSVKQGAGEEQMWVTVTFDARGGKADYATHEYITGGPYGTLPQATLAGMVFAGWWTEPDGKGTRVIETTEVTTAVTSLYAKWRDMTAADALDNPLDWTDGGDTPWVVDDTTHLEGTTSMRSGAVGDYGTSTLMAQVEGPGTVSFWWKASSEEGRDVLYLFEGASTNNAMAEISGQTKWEHCTHAVTNSGATLLRWVYWKDEEKGQGRDCAWLDGVVWMPGNPGGVIGEGVALPSEWYAMYGIAGASEDDDTDGDGLTNYEEYLVGSDPSNPESGFSLKLLWEDGSPTVVPSPFLGDQRKYTIEGKVNMDDPKWVSPTNGTHRFFRATVDPKPK